MNEKIKKEFLGVRVEDKLLAQMEVHPDFTNKTEFVTEAIIEKLGKTTSFTKNLADMTKKVENLDTKILEQKIYEVEVCTQIIFEEIKKQNELLQIIHRRSTLAAGYGVKILDDIKNGEEFASNENAKLVKIANQELDKIQLTTIRK